MIIVDSQGLYIHLLLALLDDGYSTSIRTSVRVGSRIVIHLQKQQQQYACIDLDL